MTDTSSNAGDRLDQAVEAARQAVTELRQKVTTAASGAGDELAQAIDSLSTKIDDIQAAAAERAGGQTQSQG
jgi:uncharacterized protein Yka (UPF0111/DUF47 family)